jgi:hypothetical protein
VNYLDEAVARLEGDWPDWQCWVVHRVIGGLVWCARRWDERGDVINSGSAAGLSEAIELAQQQG